MDRVGIVLLQKCDAGGSWLAEKCMARHGSGTHMFRIPVGRYSLHYSRYHTGHDQKSVQGRELYGCQLEISMAERNSGVQTYTFTKMVVSINQKSN